MNDPFRPQSDPQLLREARIGLTILAVTLGLFAYVAYHRIMGSGTQLPDHVLNAPIAQAVWPGDDPTAMAEKSRSNEPLAKQFGGLLANARNSLGFDKTPRPKTRRIFQKPKTFADPIPDSKSQRMPLVNSPPRNEVAPLEVAEVKAANNSRKPLEIPDTSIAARSQLNNLPEKKEMQAPIDFNGLRKPRVDNQVARTNFEVASDSEFSPTPPARSQPANTVTEFTPRNIKPLNRSFEATQFKPLRSGPKVAPISRVNDLATNQFASNSTSTSFEPNAAVDMAVKDAPKEIKSSSSLSVEVEQAPSELTKDSTQGATEIALDSRTDLDEKPSNLKHEVKPGESFWSIAQQKYEDGRYFRALFEYNRKQIGSFENLAPGVIISTPSPAELTKLWPQLCPKPDGSAAVSTDVDDRVYYTQVGDTLFDIARRKLGQASRYLEILELNQAVLGSATSHLSKLPSGTRLLLPLDAGH